MFTSIGYHTFVKSKSLTQEEADLLFKAFKRYMNATKEICIIGPHIYEKDSSARHFDIVYPGAYKGIQWKMRFSNKGFYVDGEFKPCSIKAIVNPKTLIGEKSYIVAADAGYLKEVEKIFDQEAEKISPMLNGFNRYSLNRIDYCINFDVSELKFDYSPELIKELPKLMMQLIKCGDIPDHFVEEYREMYQFYLKSSSVVINCYWKHDDLSRNFSECKDLEKSYNIIRFEVQFKYPKVFATSKGIGNERNRQKSILMEVLKKHGIEDFSETGPQNKIDGREQEQLSERFMDAARLDEAVRMETMLSDERCSKTIEDYFYKVIKEGDYYTFDAAKRIIERKVSKWEKVVRLTGVLQMVCDYGGISRAKKTLQGKALDEFRRSLRDLAIIGINPVTIPKNWGIEHIPNLFANYLVLCVEEQRKIQEQAINEQLLRDYMKECRKKKIPCI